LFVRRFICLRKKCAHLCHVPAAKLEADSL
jgi:hypothetical protein